MARREQASDTGTARGEHRHTHGFGQVAGLESTRYLLFRHHRRTSAGE